MKFEGIEFYGFKSFADKVSVSFNDGITAIVGPNGCGKSNIVDAIRWVLGEQSVKLLRGKKMSDVIFAGTEKRKSMSYAEVSLRFNNAGPDRIFPTLEMDEVTISRKMYRDDSSEYSINGVRARYTDIRALVRGTGLGREGYSIIGQGKIAEIISAKPENRRAIFEDAAGVLGSKIARRDAMRNLEEYETNKKTIESLMTEMQRSLTSLEKQAENAKKYTSIVADLKVLEANAYLFQKENNVVQKEKINAKIKGYIENLEKLDIDSKDWNEKFDKLTDEQRDLDSRLSDIMEEQTKLAVKKENITGQGNTLLAKKEGLLNTKQDYSDRLAKLEQDIRDKDKEIRDANNKISMDNEEKLDIEKDYNDSIKVQNDLMKEILEREQALEDKNSEINKLLESVGDIKANLGKIQGQAESQKERLKEIEEEIKSLDEKIDNNEKISAELEKAVNKSKTTRDNLESTIEKLSNRNAELIDLIDEAEETINKLREDASLRLGKINYLDEMVKNHEGFAAPVQQLLKAADNDPKIKQKILGVVASVIKVEDRLQLAIEAALGNALQNIIVNDEYTARDLIQYQKQNRIGRITFLPLTSYRPRELDPTCLSIVREKGCLGVASKLISYDPKFNVIFAGLLGNTVVIDTIDNAIDIARKYHYQVKIVTLDGEILNTTGSISGGSQKATTTGLIAQEDKLKQLKKEYNEVAKKYNELNVKYKEYKEEKEDINDQLDEYDKEFNDAVRKYLQDNGKYEAIVNVIIDLNNSKDKALENKKKVEDSINIINEALSRANAQSDSINVDKVGKDGEAKTGRDYFNSKKEEKAKLDAKILDMKMKIQELENDIKTQQSNIERLEREKVSTNSEIEICRGVLKTNETNINQADLSIRKTVISKEDLKRLSEIEAVIKKYNARKNEIIEELKIVTKKKDEISSSIVDLTDKKAKAEASLISIDEKMVSLENRIKEEYELDYDSCLELRLAEFDYVEAQSKIKSLKASKASIGPVNLDAVQQFDEEKERFDAKKTEYDDLIKAEADCKKIIDDLSKDILEKFTTEFNKINENFQEVFKELFGGGTGRLEILEPEEGQDPLDAGIEVKIQPPGKRVQHMALFSGGEQALTAMAILFAILKLRSLPFCVLDEVDAALDEGNVGIYAKYLKKFSKETQFIVITHRKPTMEKSDILFGVTMQEKGVSKMVNVNIKEAIEHSTTVAEKI